MERKIWAATAALAAYAMLAPLAVAALAGNAPPVFAMAALGASLIGPGLAAALVAWRGLGPLAAATSGQPAEEPRQALLRLAFSAALLAYVFAGAELGWAQPALPHLVELAVAAQLVAWVLLLHALVRPASRLRRAVAPLADVGLLALFLHWGGMATAPAAALFLAIACDAGLRFGATALAAAALLGGAALIAVAATTPLWRAMPMAEAALLAALAIVALYGAALARRGTEAGIALAALRDERARLAAFLHHELSLPLDAISAASRTLAVRPSERDGSAPAATLGLAARMLSGLVDAHLAAAAPAADQSFVLREALSGAVAVLRHRAEAKGVALVLSLDPRLPHLCRGSALRLGELTMNLIDAALAGALDGTVTLAAMQEGREGGAVQLRLLLTHQGERGIGGAFPRAVATALARTSGAALAFGEGEASLALSLASADEAASLPELGGARVLILTRDDALQVRLERLVAAAHGEPVTNGEAEPAIDPCAIAVIDARRDAFAGLVVAHHLAAQPPRPALILIADQAASAAIAGLAASELAAVVEEPLSDAGFAGALASALGQMVPQAPPPGPAVLVAAAEAEREALRPALERAGYRVAVAGDGGTALAAIDKGGLDAVILDLALDRMGGEAVAKLCRLRHPGSPLPLVALAGDGTGETEARCREAGFDAVAPRQGGAGEILAALERARAEPRRHGSVLAGDVALIAAHPRYLGDGSEVLREATLDSLRGLGGPEFVAEVIESFRHEAARLLARLREAAQNADLAAFAAAAHGLHGGAANVGGIRLAQTLAALEDLGENELRHAGTAFVEKIESELGRLDQALAPLALKERHA